MSSCLSPTCTSIFASMTHPIVPQRIHAIPADLPSRASLHLSRKFFHSFTALLLALANRNLSHNIYTTLTFSLFTLAFVVEILRLSNPASRFNALVLHLFRPFARATEAHQFAGIFYFLFGLFLASTLFSHTASILATLCLASLDPVAALFATLVQPQVPFARLANGKSCVGFLFAAFTAIFVSALVLSQAVVTTLSPKETWALAILVGFAGALAEVCVPTPRVVFGPKALPLALDDNAIIPVICALVCDVILRMDYHSVELSPLLLWKLNTLR